MDCKVLNGLSRMEGTPVIVPAAGLEGTWYCFCLRRERMALTMQWVIGLKHMHTG